jgi:hypothetical protein
MMFMIIYAGRAWHCIPVIGGYPQAFNYLLKSQKKTAASALTPCICISKMRGSLNI